MVLLGFALAWRSGFSIDDALERRLTEVNFTAVRNLMAGTERPLEGLNGYSDRYYGIGFHALSYPLRWPLAPLFEGRQSLAPSDALLAAEHVATFVFFLFGGYCLYRILRLARIGRGLAGLSALFFLANPYLLGHATMNIKDAPFMVAWLFCTWRMLVPAARLLREDSVKAADFAWLGVATALLLSIRVSGVLIGLPYLVTLATAATVAPAALVRRRRDLLLGLGLFAAIALLLTWASYPLLWPAPWKVVEALRFMAHHPWASCSFTWGTCMPAQELPWSYVPGWILVKISLVGLIGFGLAVMMALLRPPSEDAERMILRVLVVSPLLVVLTLILSGASLYNEIRQVLFLVPMVYLAAFVALARRPRLAAPLLAAGLTVAAADHVLTYPYPYVWFNEAARFLDIDRNFETDYWALSAKEVALVLRDESPAPDLCTFAPYPHQLDPFLPASEGVCLRSSFELKGDEPRPFLLSRIPHTEEQGYGTAPGCEDIYVVRRRLFLSPQPMTLGTLQVCA